MKMHLGTRLGIAFGLISCIVFLSIGGLCPITKYAADSATTAG